MRLTVLALVLAVVAPRSGCGNGTPAAYDACAGKACGERCTVCAPDDRDCAETAVVKACDPDHRCVPQTDRMCAVDPCAGKVCGVECTIDPPCRSAVPPCMVPSQLGHCDPSGVCVAGAPTPNFCPPAPPSWGCVGKACGDPCGYCPPGTDPARCPVATFAPTACDAALQCVTVGTFSCTAAQACAGKACGAECDVCGGACARPYATACDASGSCVPAPATCGP